MSAPPEYTYDKETGQVRITYPGRQGVSSTRVAEGESPGQAAARAAQEPVIKKGAREQVIYEGKEGGPITTTAIQPGETVEQAGERAKTDWEKIYGVGTKAGEGISYEYVTKQTPPETEYIVELPGGATKTFKDPISAGEYAREWEAERPKFLTGIGGLGLEKLSYEVTLPGGETKTFESYAESKAFEKQWTLLNVPMESPLGGMPVSVPFTRTMQSPPTILSGDPSVQTVTTKKEYKSPFLQGLFTEPTTLASVHIKGESDVDTFKRWLGITKQEYKDKPLSYVAGREAGYATTATLYGGGPAVALTAGAKIGAKAIPKILFETSLSRFSKTSKLYAKDPLKFLGKDTRFTYGRTAEGKIELISYRSPSSVEAGQAEMAAARVARLERGERAATFPQLKPGIKLGETPPKAEKLLIKPLEAFGTGAERFKLTVEGGEPTLIVRSKFPKPYTGDIQKIMDTREVTAIARPEDIWKMDKAVESLRWFYQTEKAGKLREIRQPILQDSYTFSIKGLSKYRGKDAALSDTGKYYPTKIIKAPTTQDVLAPLPSNVKYTIQFETPGYAKPGRSPVTESLPGRQALPSKATPKASDKQVLELTGRTEKVSEPTPASLTEPYTPTETIRGRGGGLFMGDYRPEERGAPTGVGERFDVYKVPADRFAVYKPRSTYDPRVDVAPRVIPAGTTGTVPRSISRVDTFQVGRQEFRQTSRQNIEIRQRQEQVTLQELGLQLKTTGKTRTTPITRTTTKTRPLQVTGGGPITDTATDLGLITTTTPIQRGKPRSGLIVKTTPIVGGGTPTTTTQPPPSLLGRIYDDEEKKRRRKTVKTRGLRWSKYYSPIDISKTGKRELLTLGVRRGRKR